MEESPPGRLAPTSWERQVMPPPHPSETLRVEFIGTGNAYGIPASGCECQICKEAAINLERRRTPPCAIIATDESALIIDAGDLSLAQKLARYNVEAILISHFHAGHLYGLNSLPAGQIPHTAYGPPDGGESDLRDGIADIKLNEVLPAKTLKVGDFEVTPVLLNHGPITYGYCISIGGYRIGYLCDTCELPPNTEEFITNWTPDILIIDCNQPPERPRPNHNTPHQAFAIHRRCGSKRSYLSHLSCDADRWLENNPDQIPVGVEIARDGMVAPLGVGVSRRAAG